MGSIPPVPPSGSSSYPYDSNMNQDVQTFQNLWDSWWDHPTRENAEKLLSFMEKHKEEFEQLSKKNPHPPDAHNPSFPNFEHAFASAEKDLKAWMDHGCNPNQKTAPSEFISDVYQWVHY